MNVLDIKQPSDIKVLSIPELEKLAKDIRSFLVESIAQTGGHLSSNLGIVELTLAMHYVFQSPSDKFIYDVGHQSYIHKILTGRAKEFSKLRQYQGISGFQKRKESEHDSWEAGHSSTALSAALGFAVARDLNKEDYQVLPVVGDGSLASGMSFEALNEIGSEKRKMVIVFNDNEMSISKNVGAMSQTFTKLRSSKRYTGFKHGLQEFLSSNSAGQNVLEGLRDLKNNIKHTVVDASFFDDFGLDYIGPIDGHNLHELIRVFEVVKKHDGPIVVHVITQKGKGYLPAQLDDTGAWHGVGKFDVASGKMLSTKPIDHKDWSSIMSDGLLRLAKENEDIVALTPAMMAGSKLQGFYETYPERFFDCGIAEEHAVTFAAALAAAGKRPFISIYSSFLQRAYDQMNHDIARMNLPVVVSVDRAGLVGEDGETHHGLFDIAMFRNVPNLVLSQPKDAKEAHDLLYSAFLHQKPWLIRIPRGSVADNQDPFTAIEIGSWSKWQASDAVDAFILTYGPDVDNCIQKAKLEKLNVAIINARFFKPLDTAMLQQILTSSKPVVIYETDMKAGGLSSAVLEYANDHNIDANIVRLGIDDHFVCHGNTQVLRQVEHIDLDSCFMELKKVLTCD
ncbi:MULTISPECIES: 1-deoxy-D-xylulose-5-phosphate synthase [unclassified Breznakia]|uniref:1-deoxy-D-xylulose-5-phosphate synthase n=1 Tax=unclassified Breznakia TaxID=2623764 RepID=UPI002476DEDF|nr:MULTISPECIES: 1-deoxy-D-xylulose-5-phosphate synthase [unclassified Breznakia]MDH6366360.1 1-deoxy-D-xylulose-5-phosphate synthase [Breznakia sp. PH1-1]MDH6403453.1 1-deoxy-D-xylulose-5-phosphate synthase [Breznakia sp. PF1-11]MDH6411162.1 1-deoxy-D-xylulose-5-phosphate synthase [Breznakia sp. PFB1-11]MDH6413575.1 1-deoxy-D-xylulose-5-phosphate synthase [Breznakia sp. PFB1-14]MDH6415707.1 1-deoxy-D-xylulose-5-phosphate synthase [Breznakia sp. PFB1-4]